MYEGVSTKKTDVKHHDEKEPPIYSSDFVINIYIKG